MHTARFPREALLLLALGACEETVNGNQPDAARADAAPDVTPDVAEDTAPPEDVAPPPDMPPAASGIGDACETDQMFTQGTCRTGQICLTQRLGYRNGYCIQVCNGAARCPSDAVCSMIQGFPVCLRRCTSNTDCRADDGYVCAVGTATGQRVCNVNDEPVGLRPDGSACFSTAGSHPAPALMRRTFSTANVSVSAARRDTVVNAEGNVAAHPSNGNVTDSYIGVSQSGSFMGVSFSSTGGMTWNGWGTVADPLGSASDPVLDWGSDAVLRMTYIGLQRTATGQVQRSTIRITESMDNGANWAMPRQVEPTNFCQMGGICDKPWLLSAPGTTPGSMAIYLGYLQQTNATANVVVQRSDDAGRTWSTPTVVGRLVSVGQPTIPNLVQVAAGAPGEVGATWIGLSAGMAAGQDSAVRFGSSDNRVFYRRTTDGFRTVDSSHTVTSGDHSPVYMQAPVAIDGSSVHVAFVSGESTGAWDIILATSTDGGSSWQYRTVNDDPEHCATHTLPAMVVDHTTHDLHLIWLENRFGEGAVAYARCPGNAAMRCGTNEQVSDASFRLTTGRNPQTWHGDYLGLTLNNAGELWASWSDTRTGRPQMYVARGRAR